MAISVYLIEDHLLMHYVLTEFITKVLGLTLCGAALTGEEALKQLPNVTPDIILTDIALPDIDGIHLVKELGQVYPQIPVIIFSSYREAYCIQRALAAGGRGYILKGDPSEIAPAIQQVLNGVLYLSPPLLNYAEDQLI